MGKVDFVEFGKAWRLGVRGVNAAGCPFVSLLRCCRTNGILDSCRLVPVEAIDEIKQLHECHR